jgi:hypothetical protein
MKMVRIYDANNLFEAHLVRQHLSHAGIDAEVRGEHTPYPGIPFSGGGGSILAVWVPETQRERALAAIAAGVETEEGAEEP